ncbi:hypothetical protein Gohar_017850 [Gossypium harknessii]|uniref:RNase H type-1 domain-containing protein n=1 Tax=Gossypium harknessii TaxID=34285 RepID=A0A7J9G774_9ROSI|nr:hypothetical protein [Gossypium harknessii]
MWMHIVPIDQQHKFFSETLQDWLTSSLCCHMRLLGRGIIWSCLFGLIAWRIWKKRNLFIFQGKWVHLFTDGAVDRGSGSASASGVLRDQNGNWILGVMIKTDNPEVVKALQDNMMVDSGITVLRRV